MKESTLTLRKASKAFGEPHFRDVVLEELHEQVDSIELQQFCEQGGWPDDESIELTVDSVKERRGEVLVRIACAFEETVPTSCSEVSFPNSVCGRFVLRLDVESGTAKVEYENG